jgi:transcriptional regulator with XRE-family HTH domain
VRTARAECGISQGKLGSAIGVTFQQVQKYERAANRISASMLAEIAVVVRKPITYFYDPVKYKPNTRGEEMAEFVASRAGSQLIAAAVDLDPALRQHLIDIARSMNRVAA